MEITQEGVLSFHSCSKRSGMTGYRVGFVAGDSEVLKLYARHRNSTGTAPSVIMQSAAASAWGDDQHVEERRKIFKCKRDVFLEFFKSYGIEVFKTDATFYLWAKFPNESNPEKYFNALLDKGIVISPGHYFHPEYKEYFRLALVPTLEECQKAIQIWKEVK